MNFLDLEKAIESLIDWVIGSDPKEVINYIDRHGLVYNTSCRKTSN
jgi:hypothetical protein